MTDHELAVAAIEIGVEAVGKIVADLRGRHGLRHRWDKIDKDVQARIQVEWVHIIDDAVRRHIAPNQAAAIR